MAKDARAALHPGRNPAPARRFFGGRRRTWPSGSLFWGGFQPDFTRPSLLSLPRALGAARGVPGMLSACQHAPHRPSPPADALLRGCPNPGTPRPRCPRRDEPHQGPLLPARMQPSDFCHPPGSIPILAGLAARAARCARMNAYKILKLFLRQFMINLPNPTPTPNPFRPP